MTAPALSEAQVKAYLDVLGVARAAPSHAALCSLVRAQVTRVPFENVSKLLLGRRGLRDVPDIEAYLEAIRRYHFGGTCYPNGFHFYRLLHALGYNAALCGAAMRSGEDVHVVITVAVEGRTLLVDVGYGGPFLAPMPLDSDADLVVVHGRDRYVLKPRDTGGRSRLEMYRHGAALHGYLVDPTPRTPDHFRSIVQASFRDSATFMNAVVAIRHRATGSVAIHNLSLVRSSRDGWSEELLPDRAALVAALEGEFSIPAERTREAIAHLGSLGDVY